MPQAVDTKFLGRDDRHAMNNSPTTHDLMMRDEAITRFAHYLNLWHEDANYTIDDFNPDRNPHASPPTCDVLEALNATDAFPAGVLKVWCNDGDEGGGSTLYVGFDEHHVTWIVHVFDLTPTHMWNYDEGYRKP